MKLYFKFLHFCQANLLYPNHRLLNNSLGSLAILMWLEIMRRKGVNFSLREYLKVGATLSIAQVAIASLVLWVELGVLGFKLF